MNRRTSGTITGEFLGCLVLVVIGLGTEAAVAGGGPGDRAAVMLGWGFGVLCGVALSARLSGAHLNPALTVGLAVCGRFPWRAVPRYVSAQLAGGFAAALVVHVGYRGWPAPRAVPGGLPAAFGAELVATVLLVLVLCLLITSAGGRTTRRPSPVLVAAVGLAWGAGAGFVLNPARDLGPRVVSLLAGPDGQPAAWLPVLASVAGGLVGGALFRLLGARLRLRAAPRPTPPQPTPPRPAPPTPVPAVPAADPPVVPEAPLFAYGSLQFEDVLLALLERVPQHSPAELYGWRAAAQPGADDAGLVPANPLTKVSGVVLDGLERADWDVLDAFEDPGYTLTLITLADGRAAWSYTCAGSAAVLESDWSVGRFADHHLSGYVQRCAVWRAQFESALVSTGSRRQCRADHRGGRSPARGPRPAGKRQHAERRADPPTPDEPA